MKCIVKHIKKQPARGRLFRLLSASYVSRETFIEQDYSHSRLYFLRGV